MIADQSWLIIPRMHYMVLTVTVSGCLKEYLNPWESSDLLTDKLVKKQGMSNYYFFANSSFCNRESGGYKRTRNVGIPMPHIY